MGPGADVSRNFRLGFPFARKPSSPAPSCQPHVALCAPDCHRNSEGAILIAASILAAHRIAGCEGKPSPALERVIAGAIATAEKILARIDRGWRGPMSEKNTGVYARGAPTDLVAMVFLDAASLSPNEKCGAGGLQEQPAYMDGIRPQNDAPIPPLPGESSASP